MHLTISAGIWLDDWFVQSVALQWFGSFKAQKSIQSLWNFQCQALISKHPLPWMIQIITTEIINCFTKHFIWWLQTSTFLNCWHSNKPESFMAIINTLLLKVGIVLPPQTFKLGWLSNAPQILPANILKNQRARHQMELLKLCIFKLQEIFLRFSWGCKPRTPD